MLIRVCTCALLSLLLAGRAEAQFSAPQPPVAGENFHVELGVVFWEPPPDITATTGGLGVIGSDTVDFVKEFGIEKDRFREFRATLHPARKHKIRFAYVPIKYSADAVLQRSVTFQGQVFNVGLPATADLKWDLWRFGYEYDFISRRRGLLGLITELNYHKISANVSSQLGSATLDQKAPVPAIGLIGRGYLHDNLSITAEFTGFKVPERFKDTIEGKQYNFDIYATASVSRFLALQAGYRSLTVDYARDDDAGHLQLKGTYFGGLVRF